MVERGSGVALEAQPVSSRSVAARRERCERRARACCQEMYHVGSPFVTKRGRRFQSSDRVTRALRSGTVQVSKCGGFFAALSTSQQRTVR
jgi:ABC-type taurine transport system substrate-binding protein